MSSEVSQTDDAAAVYASLNGRGKVAFSESELFDARNQLDQLVEAISSIRVFAEDPDGVVQITVGSDGRMEKLWIDPGATKQFTNLVLETKFNETMRDALAELARARAELSAAPIRY